MAVGGAPVVEITEAIVYDARGWRAFRWLGAGLHREGVGLRVLEGRTTRENEAAGVEDTRMRRWTGEVLRDMGPLSRIGLE